MNTNFDVVVIGGGTAGVIAAVQAGRAGAKTLLVEKNGMLGGTVTLGGISYPAHFFAWGRQVIAGIGWELVRRTIELERRPVPTPDYTRDNDKPGHVGMDKVLFAGLCDEAVLAAGVEPLYHAMPAEIAWAGGWTIRLCTKTGLREVKAKVLIDATGDANAVTMAGFEVTRPAIVQPATLSMRIAGYDLAKLDIPALKAAADAAIAAGELKSTDLSWRNWGPESFLKSRGGNANHFHAEGAESSEGRTAAEIEGRQTMLRMYRFFKKQPGLENFHIEWVCPEVGIRETVTIKGKATIRVADYESGMSYPDAVCYAYYNIDEHLNDGEGINYRRLKLNVLPSIPRGALLPAGSRGLIVAGRCLSSDREANSALRVEAPCMAMGQAAGALAALSARTGQDPEAVPMDALRALLKEHGAIVPPDLA